MIPKPIFTQKPPRPTFTSEKWIETSTDTRWEVEELIRKIKEVGATHIEIYIDEYERDPCPEIHFLKKFESTNPKYAKQLADYEKKKAEYEKKLKEWEAKQEQEERKLYRKLKAKYEKEIGLN